MLFLLQTEDKESGNILKNVNGLIFNYYSNKIQTVRSEWFNFKLKRKTLV